MKQYIIEKVQRDPVTHYQYAGGMYPYRLMKRVMKNACSGGNRIEISKTLKTKSMSFKTEGAAKMTAKVESLLEKNPGQGIGISLNVTALSPQSGYHAVNIIGCRTVKGVQEVLIHNSWGSSCKNDHFRYQAPDKCQSGRAWIPTSTIMSYSQEIQWLEK